MKPEVTSLRPLKWMIWPIVAVAATLGLFVFVQTNRTTQRALREEIQRLQQENQAKQAELVRRVIPSEAVAEEVRTTPPLELPATPPGVESRPAARPVENLVMTPSGRAPPPRDTGLILAGTHVSPISGGLRTTLRFNSTITEPMGIVAIVVRLPVGDSRVLDFGPMAPDAFSLVSSRVSEDGKFAIFQGTAAALKSVDFALSVTGPVVADVRGTCGVGPMALQIMPTGASVKAP